VVLARASLERVARLYADGGDEARAAQIGERLTRITQLTEDR